MATLPFSGASTVFLTLILVVHIVGVAANAVVLATFVHARRRLIESRIDRINVALVSIMFILSVLRVINYVLASTLAPPLWYFLGSMVLLLVSEHCLLIERTPEKLLALERYFISLDIESRTTRRYFLGWGAFKATLCLISLSALAAQVSKGPSITVTDSIPKLDTLPFIFLAGSLVLASSISTIGTAVIYYLTYRNIVKKLYMQESNHRVDRLVGLLERQVFRNTFLMSATICFCYVPQAVVAILVLFGVQVSLNVGLVCVFLIALDTVVTPCQILYFVPAVKQEMMVMVHWK
ncbi:hypothetical protein BJ741DRAFT_608869 [Chytriomyces cf. hyalinus JEL632]|nr:hypothetical protein BJ741DRAFT_608869 [Chytriomyces cf. hyalinus JEL632]